MAITLLLTAGRATGAAAAPQVPVALAGANLPDVTGPAGYRGGLAIVALGEHPFGALAVCGPDGQPVRRLEPIIGSGSTAWAWDGRDGQGVLVLTGRWVLRLDGPGRVSTAVMGQVPAVRGRVSFTVSATAGR